MYICTKVRLSLCWGQINTDWIQDDTMGITEGKLFSSIVQERMNLGWWTSRGASPL